jgi:hypothetical protein
VVCTAAVELLEDDEEVVDEVEDTAEEDERVSELEADVELRPNNPDAA